MNPMVSLWLGALLRALIGPALTWVALRGGIDAGNTEIALTALVGVLLNVIWVLWVKYRERLHFLKALEMPNYTPESVVRSLAKYDHPSVWERR